MDAQEARERFARARVARLATVDATGRPHVVPVCFAVAAERLVTAVDDVKPKGGRPLRRLANVRANPWVSVLVDFYDDEDWSALWWVRADGMARVVEAGAPEAEPARRELAARYRRYAEAPPPGPFIVIDVVRWAGWAASSAAGRRPSAGLGRDPR